MAEEQNPKQLVKIEMLVATHLDASSAGEVLLSILKVQGPEYDVRSLTSQEIDRKTFAAFAGQNIKDVKSIDSLRT